MSGTSNLASWVRTHSTVRPSTSALVRSRNLWGHSTTMSSASGKRVRVANTGRASQTVTW